MTYVMDSGRGLSGPMRVIVEHDGVGSFGSFGATPSTAEVNARAKLMELFLTTTAGWYKIIDKTISEMPTFPLLVMGDTKKNLQIARDFISAQVNPVGIAAINDYSIPLSEVEKRVLDYLQGFAESTATQLEIAKAAANRASFMGHLQTLRDAFRVVIRAVVQEVVDTGAAATGVPAWVWGAAALALGAAFIGGRNL